VTDTEWCEAELLQDVLSTRDDESEIIIIIIIIVYYAMQAAHSYIHKTLKPEKKHKKTNY